MPHWHFSKPRIPVRAVIIAITALAIPFVDTIYLSPITSPANALLWLLALIPAFLLAYYRGWRGVATALAAGMAALTLAVCFATLRGVELRPELLLPVTAAYITIALATGLLSDRLHASRASAELLALTDELTGLANRRRARMFLEHAVMRARQGEALSIVMFDLDRFKAYNDRNGHPAGDVMLCTFASVLTASGGAGDLALAVRYGGEEFMAVLSDCNAAQALAFAERVRASLSLAQGGRDPITVSAGIATYGGPFGSANEMIVAADRALYCAKKEGRDRVCVAAGSLTATVS